MRPLNYTTQVPVTKTVGEVQDILAGHGADAVMVRYTDRQPTGVSFSLPTVHGTRTFTLPVDVAAVTKLLEQANRKGKLAGSKLRVADRATPEQAARVAWRVAKDWLEAQLAMVDAHMASLEQVMLPYLHVPGTAVTVYEAYREREQAAIEGGPA